MSKVLLIGYGSIGKRHEEVLLEIPTVEKVDLVTKQNVIDKKTFVSLEKAPLNEYDYFVIASETSKHYDQLNYLENSVSDKYILCEKPLFHKNINCNFYKNKICIGYVMRYHPMIQKLKKTIEENNDDIIFSSIYCGQYLPDWRPNQDYRKTYSASSRLGGGVLKDLSHEVDYAQFLFGDFIECNVKKRNVSSLEIDTDDCTSIYARSAKNTEIVISVDYLSHIPMRQVIAHSNTVTYIADLINLELKVKAHDRPLESIVLSGFDRNYAYKQMHKDVMSATSEYACSFTEALRINSYIS